MATQTLIEAQLCKLWARAERTGDWWALFEALTDIAGVMYAAGQPGAFELFHEAAMQALDRRVYEVRSMGHAA